MPFPVEKRWIDATEAQLGTEFPSSYREAMMRWNGGAVSALDETWELFPIRDDSEPERTRRTSNDVLHETQEARGWQDFPSKGVAIAGNGTGDLLVFIALAEGKPLRPTVYWWDHEYGQMQEIAGDFRELRSAG
jgi:hypothetical protein